MPDATPLVACCRTLPGELRIEGADVRVLGDDRAGPETTPDFVRGAAIIVSTFHDKIGPEILEAAGPALRGVCNYAVGFDNIDLAACRERGVTVTNTPDAVTEGTANMAWLLVMAAARRLIEVDRYARSGDWATGRPLAMGDFMGMDLTGKTLLIVGAGRIGYATALRALAFGMRIEYVARTRKVHYEQSPLGARWVSLDEGLAAADVVSVHTPLSESTRHQIGAREIALMKPDAILVNTARGPVVDERALADALARGYLWGAGLDVFEHEPKVHPGLVGAKNVVMAPHIGSAEIRWREAMTVMVAENASAILEGRE
ncbi:MAG: D-glycerate dehydrogenase, partial [Planctomycetota bacterium]